MKKPDNYELKKWLCENIISGLRVFYYQTGTDTSDTDWELTITDNKKKRLKADTVKPLVDVIPDWMDVMRPKRQYQTEVNEYKKFAKKEASDLAEYERLKKKFEE